MIYCGNSIWSVLIGIFHTKIYIVSDYLKYVTLFVPEKTQLQWRFFLKFRNIVEQGSRIKVNFQKRKQIIIA